MKPEELSFLYLVSSGVLVAFDQIAEVIPSRVQNDNSCTIRLSNNCYYPLSGHELDRFFKKWEEHVNQPKTEILWVSKANEAPAPAPSMPIDEFERMKKQISEPQTMSLKATEETKSSTPDASSGKKSGKPRL